MVLTSTRLYFRRFNEFDLEKMRELESDPLVMRWTPMRLPQSIEKTKERLQKTIAQEQDRSPQGIWAVESREGSHFIGWAMLIKTEGPYPELGFMITRAHWKKGFATELSVRLLRHAFEDLRFDGVTATADKENLDSIHVLKKLGFQTHSERCQFDKVMNCDVSSIEFRLMKFEAPFLNPVQNENR